MKFNNLLPELPFPQPALGNIFQKEHERYAEIFPGWSLNGTRKKLTAIFWRKILLNHFGILMLTACILVLLFGHQSILFIITSAIATAFPVFLMLLLSLYFPYYQFEFLPHLDSCVENYKGIQLNGIQQCKKQQYSVLSLMLIQLTLQQLAGMEPILNNAITAQQLARQYGVSVKSISPVLQLISRGDWDKKSIRKRTEIIGDFETASEYFNQLSENRAIVILDKLQQHILK